MEIRAPGFNRIQKNTGPVKKVGKNENTGFADAMDERASTPIHQSAAVFSVDPMFANLNEPSAQQKGFQKGLSLLDELEKLRGQLLCGNGEPESIMSIQNQVNQLRADETDDRLQDLLLEIETRAVVELAKHRMRGIAHPPIK